MTSPSAYQDRYPYQNEAAWSKSERAVAHKVFDAALKRELQDLIQKIKQMANQIKEPANVWDLENYLTRRRKDIDRKYDFRSSRLTRRLGTLLCERRISDEELNALGEEKRRAIRFCDKSWAENAA